ncbi:MAG TPA: YciI family protein [bacterium]|nr:YciI family protein [bacterium]
MKFVLISRHTNGAEVPENEREQNLKAMGEWVGLLKPQAAMPIRGGKSVTAKKVEEYKGDIGGILVFEADSLEQAVALAQKSPGLKYGFTHEVLPEISMEQASKEKV